jgi:1,4-dihydroxy-2-naphthoate octaprenyltransferase
MNHPIHGGVSSIRWGALLFSVPYTTLWARALIDDGREAQAILLLVAHASALLWGMAFSDKVDVARGLSPRAGALERRSLLSADPLAPAVAILGFAALIPALVLVVIDWRVGAAVLVMAVGLALYATARRARKLVLAEVLLPLIILIAPALVIGEGPRWTFVTDPSAPPPPEGAIVPQLFSPALLAATALGAVILGLVILLSFLRDRPRDLADRLRTTAVRAGLNATAALAALWLVVIVTLASMGAGWGWWHWSVPALAGVVGAWGAGAMAKGDWRAAALRMAIGHAPIGVALALSAG